MRKTVFLIHGVNSTGDWYAGVQSVLEPHFRCVPLHYKGLERRGLPKAFLSINAEAAVDQVREQYDTETTGQTEAQHVIAHSFGTVVVKELLCKYPWVRFDRMIFAGSPLPQRFSWASMLERDPGKLAQLRNETGEKDRLVRAVGLMNRVRPGLGNAGWAGFSEGHTLAGPLMGCELCEEVPSEEVPTRGVPTEEVPTRVHNVPLEEYGHSDYFLSEQHAHHLWLPWLWGLVPVEFRSFQDLCGKTSRLRADGLAVEAELSAKLLAKLPWQWTEVEGPEISFLTYVQLVLGSDHRLRGLKMDQRKLDVLGFLALQGVCLAVTTAVAELKKPRNTRDTEKLRALHPMIATQRAVEELVRKLLREGR